MDWQTAFQEIKQAKLEEMEQKEAKLKEALASNHIKEVKHACEALERVVSFRNMDEDLLTSVYQVFLNQMEQGGELEYRDDETSNFRGLSYRTVTLYQDGERVGSLDMINALMSIGQEARISHLNQLEQRIQEEQSGIERHEKNIRRAELELELTDQPPEKKRHESTIRRENQLKENRQNHIVRLEESLKNRPEQIAKLQAQESLLLELAETYGFDVRKRK